MRYSWYRCRVGDKSYIYVESNAGTVPDQNSVFAFSNDGAGNLTALPGFRYLTGGIGVSVPDSSEINAYQRVITNFSGTTLNAVNSHTTSYD